MQDYEDVGLLLEAQMRYTWPMGDSQSKPQKTFNAILIAAFIAAVVFAVLWLRERERKPEVVGEVLKPVQVIKEVPIEKIREVPKEVVKEVEVIKTVEVPAKLTDWQQIAIDFADRYYAAKFIETFDDALYKLETIRVEVFLNDEVKKVVSEDRVRNKFELILRKHGIKIDEKSPVSVNVSIDGLWNENSKFLVYTPRIELDQVVVVGRSGDFRKVIATLWKMGSYGFAGRQVVEGAILADVESLGEGFANKYLAAQAKK